MSWVAALAGVAVFAATAAFGPLLDTRPPPPEPWEIPVAMAFPPEPGPNLVVAPLGRAAAAQAMEALEWVGPRIALHRLPGECCISPDGVLQVEVFVFLGDGKLVASNVEPPPTLRKSSHYVFLPHQHVRVQEGAVDLQGLAPSWRTAIAPLASPFLTSMVAVVPDHPDASAVGPLFVTLRVV